ncbi:ABC transporter ATP-binding protein/permease [Chelatococcus reniformis]|uniref:Multidrug ABC transporter ATP-binding protein n=1 Tax=Chelatococcus reniformis TaxID=1494448 RepID=A0A916U040_9HYPH|nr:ABC transporter ATP-binding protein/permease [Chelatococcus reniformis]GGC55012.1 hypothetical protein GCM10010994_12420 [Chelatococcus reniformis]
MERSLFRYIWRHSRRDQLVIFAVVLASLPFYYWSLDLPKRIVNEAIQGGAFKSGKTSTTFFEISFDLPGFLGGRHVELFHGLDVGQLGLLFGLSSLFLFFVLINGAFKYWINVAKGALGERMLRRLRFDLFAITLRFQPETLRTVKSSETATMIKDEVEPVGGFIGDALVAPMLLGSQALTAMAFILMQNLWLGIIAGSIVAVQFTVIPRMRRIQLRLGKQRQLLSRRLAGKVGEVVDGLEAVHVHDATAWEKADMGQRLYELFDLRFRIYKWKFLVKFLNNLLAQITPFFFYAVGGYFALKGTLDIGQLVAVIAAYRDLPPPLKELIDWDQQRLDVQIKYDQVVQQFSPDRLFPTEMFEPAEEAPHLTGPVKAEDLQITDAHGTPILEHLSFEQQLPVHLALVGDGTLAASAVARVLARRITDYRGRILYGGQDLSRIPESVIGRRLAYAGPDPVLFPGSLRDNLIYGLRRQPKSGGDADSAAERIRRSEALRTGNPLPTPGAEWVDFAAVGVSDEEELDQYLINILSMVGLHDTLFRFGLLGRVDPHRYPELAERLIEARHQLRDQMADAGVAHLVETFDIDRYNTQATIGENLLFGVPLGQPFKGRGLAANPVVRKVLDAGRLTPDLLRIGARIATTMSEIFRDLPPGHPLFEQFSFIAADELDEYDEIVRRWTVRGEAGLVGDDRSRLIALPLDYIEPRHRLGMLDDGLRERMLQARHAFHEALEDSIWKGMVEFYDDQAVCGAAPLRDNLLFGRAAYNVADAQPRVTAMMTTLIDELGLRLDVERVGLDYQIGPAGRLLSQPQRAAVYLGRCLAKQPDVLILDGVFSAFGDTQIKPMLEAIVERFRDRSIVAVLRREDQADPRHFEMLVRFEGTQPHIVRGGRAGANGQSEPDDQDGQERGGAEREPAIVGNRI